MGDVYIESTTRLVVVADGLPVSNTVYRVVLLPKRPDNDPAGVSSRVLVIGGGEEATNEGVSVRVLSSELVERELMDVEVFMKISGLIVKLVDSSVIVCGAKLTLTSVGVVVVETNDMDVFVYFMDEVVVRLITFVDTESEVVEANPEVKNNISDVVDLSVSDFEVVWTDIVRSGTDEVLINAEWLDSTIVVEIMLALSTLESVVDSMTVGERRVELKTVARDCETESEVMDLVVFSDMVVDVMSKTDDAAFVKVVCPDVDSNCITDATDVVVLL